MLSWLACHFVPTLADLTAIPIGTLPDPDREPSAEARAVAAGRALDRVPFTSAAGPGGIALLGGMGCRDLVRAELDQAPDSAGRFKAWERFPFQPVEIPVGNGLSLTGHRSTGAPGAPVLIVLHGMFDSHVAFYVVETAEMLRRWGFHVVALDLRDHGRLLGASPPSSLGLAEGLDVFRAARVLSRAEGVSVGILGFSYGGHCAVRAAHEATLAGEAEVLRGGVMAVSAPLDMPRAVEHLDDPSTLPQGETFTERMIAKLTHATIRRHFRQRIRLADGPGHPCDDFEGYVREVVLPAYPDAPRQVDSYLDRARCTRPDVLGAVRVPVAIVQADDDPLVAPLHLIGARDAAADNPWVTTRLLAAGGHACMPWVDATGTFGLYAAFFGRLRDG